MPATWLGLAHQRVDVLARHRRPSRRRSPACPRASWPTRRGCDPIRTRSPRSGVAAVEDVHSGVDQRADERLQLGGGPEDLRAEVLDFPLRDAERDRKVRPGRAAHLRHGLHSQPDPVLERAAVPIVATVGPLPEELIEEVAVRCVDLHAVEADPPGVDRGLAERRDDRVQIGLRGGLAIERGRQPMPPKRPDGPTRRGGT